MSVIHNERVKLTATWLNTLASATATVGVLAPLASIVYGLGPSQPSLIALVPAMAIWFFAALALHLGARRMLRGLRQ
ncbi:MAG TPA: hypothetical protein VF601_14455 [Beijerinckiaceae bacterium]|jgi:hypothetical protein